IQCSSGPEWRAPNHNTIDRPAASHNACRNSGPTSPRRLAPSNCATDGDSAIITPTALTRPSTHTFAPTATAARVCALKWPANATSTALMPTEDNWPAISGSASLIVARVSCAKRARSKDRIWGIAENPMSHETNIQPAEPAVSPPLASTEQCENCGAPLYGKYCYACGQPTTGMVRHFSSVMSDIADSVLNIDERVFKTLAPLYLRPGKLTLDYFAGRRARYVTPFRLVFFLAIVAFFSTQITVRAGFTPADKAVAISTSGGKPTLAVVPAPKAPAAPISSDDGAFANGNLSLNDKVLWNRDTKPLKIGWLPDAAVDWINDLIGNAQQQLHAMNAGSWAEQQNARRKFTLGMYSAAPTVLFVLLPL